MSVSKIFIVFFSLIFFFVFPLSASDFNIKHYQTNVEVKASGILEITETIEVFSMNKEEVFSEKYPIVI